MNKKARAIFLSIIIVILIAIALWYVFIVNKKYEVSFNSTGGTAVEVQKVINKKHATEPTVPTREDCAFDGWYIGEEPFDFETPIVENTELTAKWVCDTVMVCTSSDEKAGIATLENEVVLKYDNTETTIKDVIGNAKITFVNTATLEQMKSQVKSMLCPKNIDDSKCVVTYSENVMMLHLNDVNLVDTTKTMDEAKTQLERDGFTCEKREN